MTSAACADRAAVPLLHRPVRARALERENRPTATHHPRSRLLHTAGDGDYDYTVVPCEAVAPVPTGCAAATSQCTGGCSSFQHTPDGAFCFAAGDVNSLEASFLDPSSGVVGKPSAGITLSWGSPLSTCGTGGIFRRTVLRLICGSGQEFLGSGAYARPAVSPLSQPVCSD